MKHVTAALLAPLALALALPAPTTSPAAASSSSVVATDPLLDLGVDGADGAALYPAYDPAVERYAVTTTGSTGGSLTVETETSPGAAVRVNGVPAVGGTRTVTGLVEGDEVMVEVTDGTTTSRHSLVYLPPGFPALERVPVGSGTGAPEAGHVLLTLGLWLAPSVFYETALDENGVPAFVRTQQQAMDLKRQPNGSLTVSRTRDPLDAAAGQDLVELDDRFREVRRIRTAGLVNTDGHDSILTPDGSVWQMAYERRAGAAAPKPLDAVLQQLRPDGSVGFEWSTEEHAEADESLGGASYDPTDYAHVNSMQLMADGDLLVSFRHFSSVVKIATTARDGVEVGDVVWRLGGRRSDFTFPAGDGGPCAQHTAYEVEGGNVLVFDNGSWAADSYCVDPADLADPAVLPGVARTTTRVTEYELDVQTETETETGTWTATPVWEYAPAGRFALFAGSAQRLPGGNTLVGWASATAAIATEVDEAGEPVWEVRQAGPGPRWFTYRAHKTLLPDATPPVVEVTTPAAGATYVEGDVVAAAYSCSDRGGSSLQECGGTVGSGGALDTSTPGTRTAVFEATDGAGTTTTVTRTYTVLAAARPDAAVRVPGAGTVGADGYGAPDSQRVTARLRRPGGTVRVTVSLQNDGARPDRLAFSVPAGDRRFRVRSPYATGATTPLLAPGETWSFTFTVVRRQRTDPGRALVLRVPVASASAPGRTDGVSVRVRAVRG